MLPLADNIKLVKNFLVDEIQRLPGEELKSFYKLLCGDVLWDNERF